MPQLTIGEIREKLLDRQAHAETDVLSVPAVWRAIILLYRWAHAARGAGLAGESVVKDTGVGNVKPLELARAFMRAVQAKEAEAAAELCAEDVEVLLPGAEEPLRGRDGVRQMIRMSPEFLHSVRTEEERGDEARVTTLTRSPGAFANYTTWRFETAEGLVRRLSFELRGAN